MMWASFSSVYMWASYKATSSRLFSRIGKTQTINHIVNEICFAAPKVAERVFVPVYIRLTRRFGCVVNLT